MSPLYRIIIAKPSRIEFGTSSRGDSLHWSGTALGAGGLFEIIQKSVLRVLKHSFLDQKKLSQMSVITIYINN